MSDDKAKPKPPADEDIENLKVIAAVGYLGILFLVPYLTNPKSTFAVFHANQGLILLILGAAVNVIGMAVPILGWLLVVPLGNIFVLVLFILGIVNALQGQMKRLPLVGNFDILAVQR